MAFLTRRRAASSVRGMKTPDAPADRSHTPEAVLHPSVLALRSLAGPQQWAILEALFQAIPLDLLWLTTGPFTGTYIWLEFPITPSPRYPRGYLMRASGYWYIKLPRRDLFLVSPDGRSATHPVSLLLYVYSQPDFMLRGNTMPTAGYRPVGIRSVPTHVEAWAGRKEYLSRSLRKKAYASGRRIVSVPGDI